MATNDPKVLDVSQWLRCKTPVTWLFVGDSITQGAVHTRGFRDYTQLYKERLGELGRNEDVVINSAVGGWTTADLEPRLDERVLRFVPNIVFIMFGTNDAAVGEEGIAPFARRLRSMAQRIVAAGVSVVLQSPPPIWPVDPERYGLLMGYAKEVQADKTRRLRARQESLQDYVPTIRAAAAELSVPYIDHWSAWNRQAKHLGQLTDGGFHPNEYGHRLIAAELMKRLGMYDTSSWTCRLFVPTDSAI
jgi:lysophospholipase L1-like esterase